MFVQLSVLLTMTHGCTLVCASIKTLSHYIWWTFLLNQDESFVNSTDSTLPFCEENRRTVLKKLYPDPPFVTNVLGWLCCPGTRALICFCKIRMRKGLRNGDALLGVKYAPRDWPHPDTKRHSTILFSPIYRGYAILNSNWLGLRNGGLFSLSPSLPPSPRANDIKNLLIMKSHPWKMRVVNRKWFHFRGRNRKLEWDSTINTNNNFTFHVFPKRLGRWH